MKKMSRKCYDCVYNLKGAPQCFTCVAVYYGKDKTLRQVEWGGSNFERAPIPLEELR